MGSNYRPDTCFYCKADTWCETRSDGTPQCRGCKVERFYERVLYPPLGYSLMGWHRRVIRALFGTVKPEDGLRRYRRAYISTGKQNGKALALDTAIPTPSGWSRMGDLVAGDTVFDEAGRKCTVVAAGPAQYARPCYRLTFSDGCKIVADAQHEWPTFSPGPKRLKLAAIRTTEEIANRLARQNTVLCDDRGIVAVFPVDSVPVRCIEVDSPNHLFLAGESMIPTHNSFITAGLPLYHILMEDELNPEAYGSASAKEQAGIVFKAAMQLVNANSDLRARLKVIASAKRIVRRDGGGMYQVLSADGDVQDGIRPSLNIRDEMHRWKSAKAETLYDVTTKGQISRHEPLDIAITTAGAEYESPLWFGEYEFAKQVMAGAIPSENFYAAIWEADGAKVKADPEYWKSREARVAANPSHEDLGGFLKDEAIVAELEKAQAQPAKKSAFLRYHLNVALTSQEEPIIESAKWQACGGPVDLREWPAFDVDLLIRKWGLLERRCYVGIDASWTTDMTAIVFGFPPLTADEPWKLLPFFWIPQEKVPDFERICRVPIRSWVERGFVQQTPGNAYQLSVVRDRVNWGREMFDIQEVAYDRANFRETALAMADEDGLSMLEVSQNFMQLGAPTKFLLASYLDKKIEHGNNPVYNWHAACLQLQYDRKDGVQPSKPERMKSSKRIDGIQATVTMLNRGLAHEEDGTMSYTGLRSVG